jgi:hypothetical protein
MYRNHLSGKSYYPETFNRKHLISIDVELMEMTP